MKKTILLLIILITSIFTHAQEHLIGASASEIYKTYKHTTKKSLPGEGFYLIKAYDKIDDICTYEFIITNDRNLCIGFGLFPKEGFLSAFRDMVINIENIVLTSYNNWYYRSTFDGYYYSIELVEAKRPYFLYSTK